MWFPYHRKYSLQGKYKLDIILPMRNILDFDSGNQTELIPTRQLIREAHKIGIHFGQGRPEHRLRYLIKVGLLPHQVRRRTSYKDTSSEGYLPRGCIRLLQKIQELKRRGVPLRSRSMSTEIRSTGFDDNAPAAAGKGVLPVSSLVTTITDRKYLAPAAAAFIGFSFVSQLILGQLLKTSSPPAAIDSEAMEDPSIGPPPRSPLVYSAPVRSGQFAKDQPETALWLYQKRLPDVSPGGSRLVLISNPSCEPGANRFSSPRNGPADLPAYLPISMIGEGETSKNTLESGVGRASCWKFAGSPMVSDTTSFPGAKILLTHDGLLLTQAAVQGISTESVTSQTRLELEEKSVFNTVGSGIIGSGETTSFIAAPGVTDSSRIFTQLTSDASSPLVIAEKESEVGFTVKLSRPESTPITFDYWIIKEE